MNVSGPEGRGVGQTSTADETTGVGRYAEAVGDLALKGGPTG